MPAISTPPPLTLLTPPYRGLTVIDRGREQLRRDGKRPGSALVWHMTGGVREQDVPIAMGRPGGLALIVILPASEHLPTEAELARIMAAARPQTILPHQHEPSVDELSWCLRRPPEDLGVEVTEYLAWRGLSLDRETARLVRRTIEASGELRSISSLARALYLSRRALGRRFLTRGLPVPSHWLHFARVLRVAIRLQNSDESILSIAYELGYPDAFSVSNQMMRLVGCRPTEARECLGWEWLLEAWLRREADAGGLAPDFTHWILGDVGLESTSEPSLRRGGRPLRPAERGGIAG
jgi:AraC-like DNA-binding protein